MLRDELGHRVREVVRLLDVNEVSADRETRECGTLENIAEGLGASRSANEVVLTDHDQRGYGERRESVSHIERRGIALDEAETERVAQAVQRGGGQIGIGKIGRQ